VEGSPGSSLRRAGCCRGLPRIRKDAAAGLGPLPSGPQQSKESACSVLGRSVSPGAGRSRPSRRSDDGHMILLRVQLRVNAPLSRCSSVDRRIRTPRLLPASGRQVPTGATRRALTSCRSGPDRTRRCRGALMLDISHELHPAEVPVSTSGADSSAGTPARPRLSAAELLAAKNTRPIQSLDDLAADIFESDEELEEFLAFTYAERHRDLA
jgi:hypothetical protein